MGFLPEYVLQALIVVGGAALLYAVAEAEALGAINKYLEDYIRGKLTREEIRKKLYRLRFLPFAGREAKKTIR